MLNLTQEQDNKTNKYNEIIIPREVSEDNEEDEDNKDKKYRMKKGKYIIKYIKEE